MENKLFYNSRQSPSANSGWKRAGARIGEWKVREKLGNTRTALTVTREGGSFFAALRRAIRSWRRDPFRFQ